MTKEEVEFLNKRLKEAEYHREVINSIYPSFSKDYKEEGLVAEVLLKMYNELINKLKERDTTLTLTYEVDDTKGDDVEEVPLAVAGGNPYLKLDIIKVVSENTSWNVDEVLEDAEKVYKWVNK